ncbi:MAG: prephenate dehydrogenase/arogenate dehydrogenase family protein [Paludibacteraceae bacterium]|nr:prephenate dehydrogenase/arogenate dehydrogenase family protein [Paludibacteraceae bacterium]
MRILILGAGKMGTFLADALCMDHEVALYDQNPRRLRFVFNTQRMSQLEEVGYFRPQLLINAVTIKYTIQAFKDVLRYLPHDCILSDIASVKSGLPEFYAEAGFRFTSTHPMFGPTFANLGNLSGQNAIIIKEGDDKGKAFFRDFYKSLHLHIFDYSFVEHDQTTAYSLAVPFATTLAFASGIKKQEAPGTTFKKHMDIAHGFLAEDSFLVSEVLFNPYSTEQVKHLRENLDTLAEIISRKDKTALDEFIAQAKKNCE